MSRKIARITQDKKLLLANKVVESNAKTSLNSDGRLDTDEIIEYPAELEGGRNLLKQRSDGNYSNVYRDVIIQDGIMYWKQISTATAPFTFYLYDTTLKTGDFVFSFKTNQIEQLRPFIYAAGKTFSCSPVITEHEDYYHVSMIFKNITISNTIYFYGTEPFEPPKEVQFWDFKLEKGNKATDWTPAPEDLGLNYPDSIQNFNSSISGNNIIAPEFIEGYPFVKPVIDDSLVLWLDGSTGNNYEQTGTWKDLSGNGNDGQLVNFGYTEDSGWVDGGLKFDGVDDWVKVPINENIETKDSITMELIVTLPGDWGNDVPFECNNGNGGFHHQMHKGKWSWGNGMTSSGDYYRIDVSLEPFKKTHIVGTFESETKRLALYVNGEIKNSLAWASHEIKSRPIKYFRIGSREGVYAFEGIFHMVRIYNRALTDEEIMQNYQAGQCSPLLAMRGD